MIAFCQTNRTTRKKQCQATTYQIQTRLLLNLIRAETLLSVNAVRQPVKIVQKINKRIGKQFNEEDTNSGCRAS